MRITFTVTAGPHQGRVFQFTGHDTFIVGRSKQAHFRLPSKDRYFSRVHFLVEVNPPQCRLMDLGSRNGTHVNGRRAETAALHDGDVIRAGRTLIRVSLQETESILWAEPLPSVAEAAPVAALPTTVPALPPPPAPAPSTTPEAPAPPAACPACGAAPAAGAALCEECERCARRQPQPLPGYRVIRELGRGTMGVVSLALREADRRAVAVKTIIPAASGKRGLVQRFLREADILRKLEHPHIVAFREMGEAGERLFFAMDYVRGTDAGRLLQRDGPLPVARAAALICQLLEALEYAHARGFVHRDIKPANMLVTEEGGREVVQLADFGLARVYHASELSGLTLGGELGGTVAYMAPEQITNYREAQPPVDQYAAGATLYRLLTRELLYDFPKDFGTQIAMVLNEAPVPLRTRRPELPEPLARVVHRALERDPARRFADVRAMRAALAPFAV
jgi:eukaryotic-like serine/threonine-protein kinase